MAYDIGEAFQIIEEEMIASMSRNLKRHLATEKKEGLNYTMWQAEQLAALNNFRQDNKKRFSGYFSTINDQIEEVLKKSYASGEMTQEATILEAIREGAKIYNYDSAKTLRGQFFKINERKLNALIDATKSDMAKAETAMLRMADDEYRKVIYNSQVYLNTGVGTLSQAVDMASKDFLSRGISCIEYANGARVGIDAYSRMALRTAQTRAYLQGESSKRDEWGVNTVIVNRRGVACPKCLQYAGKVFYDDVWGNTPVPDSKYPKLSEAIAGGLYHPNCKDIHTTYFEDVSDPPKSMTQKEIDEANRVYALEQRQRYNERQIRKYKRLSEGSVDPENVAKYKQKLDYWQQTQKEFVAANSDVLKRRSELEKIFKAPPNSQIRSTFKPEPDIIKEHEHTWVEKITKQPTCTEKGEKVLVCSCGEEKKKSIPALGHDYTARVVAPTCTEKGYTIYTCSRCGHTYKDAEKPALGHDWGDWIVTRQPTATEVGRKQAICKRCGEKKYSTIPKLKAGTAPQPTTPKKGLEGAKSFTELKNYMQKKYGIAIASDVHMLDFESVKEGFMGIDRVFDEFPAAKKMFKTINGRASSGAIMSASYGGTISFNPTHYATRKAALAAHRPTWFHPKGNSPLGSAAHEAGHLLERALIDKYKGTVSDWTGCKYGTKIVDKAISSMQRADPAQAKFTKSQLRGTISGYAQTDDSECLAEAVCDYILNGENAALLSQEIWEILKKELV